MTRKLALPLILAGTLFLGGCVASLAASALGAAVQSARGEPQSNEHLKPEAVQGCTAHASQYGDVRIIDVEQRNMSKIIVWGTVQNEEDRQSFECAFGTRITGFKLRRIASLQ
jgi:hypothetical protein